MTVEALLTVEAAEGWSSLSKGLGREGAISRCHSPPRPCPEALKPHQPPCDFQAELDGAKVIDVHSHNLGQGSKQVLGLTGDAAYNHVIGQALQFCHLQPRVHSGVRG